MAHSSPRAPGPAGGPPHGTWNFIHVPSNSQPRFVRCTHRSGRVISRRNVTNYTLHLLVFVVLRVERRMQQPWGAALSFSYLKTTMNRSKPVGDFDSTRDIFEARPFIRVRKSAHQCPAVGVVLSYRPNVVWRGGGERSTWLVLSISRSLLYLPYTAPRPAAPRRTARRQCIGTPPSRRECKTRCAADPFE